MNFRDIDQLVHRRQREFNAALSVAGDTVYGQISDYWRGLLGARKNFLSAEEFNLFRHPGTSGTFGIGDSKDQDEDKTLFDQSVMELIDRYDMPDDYIARISEPLLGSPVVRPYRGNLFSQNYLKNLTAAWYLREILDQAGLGGRKLRICEIGAGFGGTLLALHDTVQVESVTVIDIAENLYLSSIFLPLCLPNLSHQLVNPNEPDSLRCDAHLNFSLPSFTDALELGDFDLVLNNASFAEMPLSAAQAYIKWAHGRLSPKGILYSFNRHNVAGASGVKRLSQYGFQRFRMQFIRPIERPSRPQNQLGYRIAASRTDAMDIDETCLDAIGDLIMCGFDEDIAPIIQAVISGAVDQDTRQALHAMMQFFRLSSLHEKSTFLQSAKLSALGPVQPVLQGILAILGGAAVSPETLASPASGVKMNLRLRALFAEYAHRVGQPQWQNLLAPAKSDAPSLCRMAERLIAAGRPAFSAMFRRDLKIA